MDIKLIVFGLVFDIVLLASINKFPFYRMLTVKMQL